VPKRTPLKKKVAHLLRFRKKRAQKQAVPEPTDPVERMRLAHHDFNEKPEPKWATADDVFEVIRKIREAGY
jgi:hypothetical protein